MVMPSRFHFTGPNITMELLEKKAALIKRFDTKTDTEIWLIPGFGESPTYYDAVFTSKLSEQYTLNSITFAGFAGLDFSKETHTIHSTAIYLASLIKEVSGKKKSS